MLGMTHRALFIEALENRWNSGYLRCLDHLRALMPAMPAAAKNQRFVFMGAYIGGVLAAREAALTDPTRTHPTWGSDLTLVHFAQTLTAMLEAPAPPEAGGATTDDRSPVVLGPIGVVPG
jgi:hypothetical protein